MTDNKKTNTKPCYFAQLFKKGCFLYSLLFIALTFSVVLLNYKYMAYAKLSANKPWFYFVLAVAGIFFVLTLVYLLSSLRKTSVTSADSIALSFTLTAISTCVYFGLRSFSIKNISFCAGLFLVGFTFLLTRAISFKSLEEKPVVITKSVSGYYKALFSKFSFFHVLVTAFVLCCLAFLIMNYPFRRIITILATKVPAILVLLSITALIAVVYVAFSVSRRKVCAFDVILLASGIVLITVLLQIILLNGLSIKQLTLWAVLVAIYLVITFIRYISFNPEKSCCCQGKKKNYLSKILCKYDGLLFLLIASAIVTLFAIIYRGKLLDYYLPVVKGRIVPAVNFFPLSVVVGAGALTVFGSIILAFATLGNKKLCLGDFCVALLEAISLLALILVAIDGYIYFVIALLLINVITLSLLIARIRTYNENR